MSEQRWKKRLRTIGGWMLPVFGLTVRINPEVSAHETVVDPNASGASEPIVFADPMATGRFSIAAHGSHSSHSSHYSSSSYPDGYTSAPTPYAAPTTYSVPTTYAAPTTYPTAVPTAVPSPIPTPTPTPTVTSSPVPVPTLSPVATDLPVSLQVPASDASPSPTPVASPTPIAAGVRQVFGGSGCTAFFPPTTTPVPLKTSARLSAPNLSSRSSVTPNHSDDENTILRAQVTLVAEGYDCGTISGMFNTSTRIALVAYQRSHALEPSGDLDSETLTAMGLLVEPVRLA